MRGHLIHILVILLLLGCSSNNDERDGTVSENPLGILGSDVPEDIRQLDKLTAYDSLDNPPYRIEFADKTILEPPEYFESRIYHQLAAGDSGRAYIQQGENIFAYDARGHHITTMGGEGKGPGELSNFSKNEMRIHGSHLYVYDERLARINVYSLDTHEPTETISMDPRKFLNTAHIDSMWPGYTTLKAPLFYTFGDTLLLIRFNPIIPLSEWRRSGSGPTSYRTFSIPSLFFPMTRKGEIVSEAVLEIGFKYLLVNQLGGLTALPVQSQSYMDVSEDARVFWADTGEFLIKVAGPNGKLERAIYYPFDHVPLDREAFFTAYSDNAETRQTLRNSDLPNTWPAITDLIVDDENRIWVATSLGLKNQYRWYVLEEDGKLLTSFTWRANPMIPRRGLKSMIRDIRDGYLFAFEPTDEESPSIGNYVSYRFKLTENAGEDHSF